MKRSDRGFEWRALCAELQEDDGVRPQRRREKKDVCGARKTRQLCAQIQRAVSLGLAGAVDDEVLRELEVVSVWTPGELSRVVVDVACPGGRYGLEEIEARLHGAAGWLRSEVARSIHRKRTPTLCFNVIPMTEEDDA